MSSGQWVVASGQWITIYTYMLELEIGHWPLSTGHCLLATVHWLPLFIVVGAIHCAVGNGKWAVASALYPRSYGGSGLRVDRNGCYIGLPWMSGNFTMQVRKSYYGKILI